MQNIRGEGGDKNSFPIVGELPAKNIDTGLGLERTAALLQGVENIYEIDTTRIILDKASELTKVVYGKNEKNDVSLRVVADHARTAMMLIGDGVTPGNEGRGYVLRRMMRRTIRNMRLLGSQDLVMSELVKSSIKAMGPQYPDGFPFDLTLEMAREQGLGVDEVGFRKLMNEQRDRAKADSKAKKSGHTDLTEYRAIIDKSGATKFVGYQNISAEAKLTGIIVDGKKAKEVNAGSEIEITLDRTPFYAEGGGQLADGGRIKLSSGAIIQVEDVQTPVPGLIVHRGSVVSGVVKDGDQVVAEIDLERRLAISRAHTATHMVHKAFREVLGETATQAGSENAPGRFRFDFPSTAAVPTSVLNDVESRVNELLIADLQVHAEVMSQDAAKAMGAMALFGEKYGDQVRVVSVGDWAKELCGGTHVSRSGQLGLVKLLSESSIGAGVRRIEALVGHDAYQYLAREHVLLNSLTEIIKGVRTEELPQRISELIEKMKGMEKELSTVRSAKAMASAASLVKNAKVMSGINLIVEQLADEISVEDMRSIALDLRSKIKDGVVVLATVVSSKPLIVASVSPEAIKLGIKAGELIKTGSTILGGGGGGKDDFAQGGGTDSGSIVKAMAEITEVISGKIK